MLSLSQAAAACAATVESAAVSNCIIVGNTASYRGGGASRAKLNNCVLTGNWAFRGGGASGGTLNNCTVTGNTATNIFGQGGGGTDHCTLNNCIVYYNSSFSEANSYLSTFNYCCTTPLPANGVGNITNEPQFATLFHLSASSPCRAAGSAAYATGLDIDGEPWLDPPSIGCDEYWAGFITGDLTVGIEASATNVLAGVVVSFTANIDGRAAVNTWDFGDGALLSNRLSTSRAWGTVGDYPVVLRAYNETHLEGVSATVVVRVLPPVHLVSSASLNPAPPYLTWETAARAIQDAVDVAQVGAVVLVTNGVYGTGGRPAAFSGPHQPRGGVPAD